MLESKRYMLTVVKLLLCVLVFLTALECSSPVRQEHLTVGIADSSFSWPIISDTNGMETAWDIPMNPLTDSTLGNSFLAEQVRYGFQLFTDTTHKLSRFSANKMTCANCHLNAGQRERALPLVGVAGMFPEYNKRAGRLFSLEDRILECFKRSMDASQARHNDKEEDTVFPTTESREVLAISAFISWLSAGYPTGKNVPWRGQNVIPATQLISVEQLDIKRGEALYMERCVNCHDEDGQGVEIGDIKAGPLWGDDSWNDGAGAGRIYTLAGMIRYMMPYQNPGTLTDEEAQQIAAFIDSKPRPRYPYKEKDYPDGRIPSDAVYYKR